MTDIYSNIAIDLGGKHTGFISYTVDGKLDKNDIYAGIIEMPDQGSGMNYTVKERTATRHHVRAEDRFKIARKFIYLAIQTKISREMAKFEKEAISSFMKRRGYTRLETEIDLDILKDCSVDIFAMVNNEGNLFTLDQTLFEQFSNKCTDLDSAKKYEEFFKSEQLTKEIESVENKDEKKLYKDSLSEMKKAAQDIISQAQFGHKHRKVYLENIRQDIEHDARLAELIKEFGGCDDLYRCIGNISNFQLRALRWYFNDISMKGNPKWDNERFKDIWVRAVKFFHYPDFESRNNAKALIKTIRNTKNSLDALSTIDPILTIPPYEDQNNRRPPEDQTLLLSPEALDKRFNGKWEKWVDGFVKILPVLSEDLDDIVKTTDRKSRIEHQNSTSLTLSKLKHSYALQRLLDLSYNDEHDITKIRSWASNPDFVNFLMTDKIIKDTVGEEDYKLFLDFAKSYYDEVKLAKEGLWSVVENPLMEISGIHPSMKCGILGELVAGVLSARKDFDYEHKFKALWNSKINQKSRSTVKSICKSIEEKRKDLGNSFNIDYKKVCYKALMEGEKSLKTDQKELYKIKEKVELVSKFLADNLKLDVTKFNNPFSLAQLYTLIETDTHGFSSTCKAVNSENNFRMRNYLSGNGAFCSRLPAESVRPFDGSLAKILKRQAYEIGKRKACEFKELPDLKNASIHLGVLIEENQFEFTASIAKIKKSKFAKKIEKSTDKRKENQEKRYQDKRARIINASRNICPYTGETLLENTKCEFDHIIPRSFTKEKMGTIFNSEANLIYTSQRGNQEKKEKEYHLEDLNSRYLKAVFDTDDRTVIRNTIDKTIKEIQEKNDNFLFDLMSDSEKDCCRHALFMPGTKSYDIVVAAMAKQYSTRVNGTQSWFIREIISSIKHELGSWLTENNNKIDFFASKIDVMNMAKPFREELGKLDQNLAKKEVQPISSHAIDALCVLAGAVTDKRIANKIGAEDTLIDITKIDNLYNIVPEKYEIIRTDRKGFADKDEPQSRKLYKDTIYGEHFLPIMVMNGEVRIGFDWGKNCVEVTKGKEKLIELLSEFFTEEIKPDEKYHSYKINNRKAFELIHKVHSNDQDVDENELEQCTLLKAIYYSTISKDVISIYDSNKKSFIKENDLLKDDIFKIKIGSLPENVKFSGKALTLPSINEWRMIANKLSDLLGHKASEFSAEISKDPEKAIFDRIGHEVNHKSSKINHKSVRRVYSLPVLAYPSGGIRIKRQDFDGNPVYQLVAANTPDTVMSKGFGAENGILNWKKSVNVEAYAGNRLTKFDSPINLSEDFVSMGEKRDIVIDGITRISMSPGTEGRRFIFIEQSFEDFNKCIGGEYLSYFDIPSELKVTDLELFKQNLNCSIAGVPRGNLKITEVGSIIKYNYTVNSSNDEMNKSYNSSI